MGTWIKNLGFVIVCLAGLGLLLTQLLAVGFPPMQQLDAPSAADRTLREVVDRVDAEFSQAWQQHQLTPAPLADDWTLMRRLSLALTGTIPSLEEIRMMQRLPAAARRDAWLEHLLADRRCSDYLAERLARVYVGTENGPFLVYRRRRFVTWLSDQLHANRPYDDLVRELISGRGIWTDSPAVNFLTVTNDVNGDEQPDEQRLAARTARAFLGVRLDCVQCHDDNLGGDWRQQDFQQLAAFFVEANSSLLGIQDQPREYEFKYLHSDTSEVVPAHVPFEAALCTGDGVRREQLARWVTHPDNRAFSRATVNRIWALMFGQPLVTPVDNLPLDSPFPPGLDAMAADFAQQGFDLRRLIRLIAATQPFHAGSQHPSGSTLEHEQQWAVFPVTRLRPEQVAGSLLQAASLTTIDANSHILVRLARYEQQNEFVSRYGDTGEDEFSQRSGTIPQRLLMMNGSLVSERTKDDLVKNSVTRNAAVAADDQRAIAAAYWGCLTREPSDAERDYFMSRLARTRGPDRRSVLEDLYWAMFNSAEFSWNH
jgi:hypothetical protein